MKLAKATIEILDIDNKAVDPPRLPKRFEVQFNPTSYALSKSAQLQENNIPGLDSPVLTFLRGQNEKLSMEFFFDTTEFGMGENAQDVNDLLGPVYQLVKIQPRTHTIPRIRLTWGETFSFQAIVESVQRKYTLFSPQGVPLRATASVTFREYKTKEEQLKELNKQSSDHTKYHQIKQGESLSDIAAQAYDDPGMWRLIADTNRDKIPDPFRLPAGVVLQIPPSTLFNPRQVNP